MLFIHEGFPWFSHKSSCEAFCLLVNARLWSLASWWLVWVRHVCFAAPLICVGWSLLCSCAQASPSAILCLCKAGACQCLSFGLSGYPVPANPDPSRPFNEERLLLARLQVSQSALMLSGLLMLSMATPALPRTEGCQKRELELRRCRYKSVQQRLKSLLTLERLSCQWETWPVSTLSFEWLKAFNAFNSLQVRPHPMRTWEKGRVCTSRESRVANLRSSSAELRIDRGQRLTADRWLRWLLVWWGNVGSFSSEEIMSGLNLLIMAMVQ